MPAWDASDPRTTFKDETEVIKKGKTLAPLARAFPPLLFRGGSNKPFEVDVFLSYVHPQQRVTDLPPGEQAFVVVFFAHRTLPGTFRAEFNRQDVTSRFRPVPGRFGGISLEPAPGRNTLVLSIDGIKPDGRQATDTDRLVWEVARR